MRLRKFVGCVLLFTALTGCADRAPAQAEGEVSFGDLDERIRKYVSSKAPTKIGTKSEVKFGDNFVLLGYDVSDTKFRPGDTITVTWYWQCLRPVAAGWQLFTHGIKGEKEIVLNSGNKGVEKFASVRKKFPPSAWKPKTFVKDIQKLRIPDDFSPDQLELRVGVWLGNDRVPVKKGRSDGDNRARGPVLKKKPPKKIESVIKRIADIPKIDGEIAEEELWTQALHIKGFKEIIKGRNAKMQTDLYLGFTDEFLLIAVRAEDTFLSIPKRAEDGELWRGDALTLLLDPGGDDTDYYEIQINPALALYDAEFASYRKADASWNSDLKYAVKIDGSLNDDSGTDGGWQAELQIPLASFGEEAPKEGDVWHVNFFRTDVQKERTEYSAWSPPLRGDFHHFKKFGKLSFDK